MATGPTHADFRRFFVGQTASSLGSSVTLFALPLLVFDLTGSALDLGIATAATFAPYLLFGLLIGAWVDRVDRRQLMIATDLLRAAVVAVIPALAFADRLTVEAVYAVAFANATLGIAFDAAQFAAIPSLVSADDLVSANGRVQASYSAAMIAGPPLAGFLAARFSVADVLLIDAGSYLVSAASLGLVRRSFNPERAAGQEPASVRALRRDVVEGLRYVFRHPVLRSISLMMALFNFVGSTIFSQLVLFAKDRLDASDAQIGLLFAADAGGVVVLSLAAGWLHRRFPFAVVALGALLLDGVATIGLAMIGSAWLALVPLAMMGGFASVFNISTASLRQRIVPNHLLGRVMSIAGVLAFTAIPLGALLGGWMIETSGNIALVYAGIGALSCLIAVGFAFSPLGHAERHLPAAALEADTSQATA